MILLYIFILGCFVSGIVLLGLVFALAASGYTSEDQRPAAASEDAAQDRNQGTPNPQPVGIQVL
jgi:hypothetical protein